MAVTTKTQASEVELRTVPNVRDSADADTFVKDYLAQLDEGVKADDLPDEFVKRQYADMRQTAMQRGLRPKGEPKLIESKAVDARNVLLTYSVSVVVATSAPEQPSTVEKAAVAAEQSATGEKLKTQGEPAKTADGKNVDTTGKPNDAK